MKEQTSSTWGSALPNFNIIAKNTSKPSEHQLSRIRNFTDYSPSTWHLPSVHLTVRDPCQPTNFLIPNLLAQPKRQIFLPGFLETVWISIGIIAMLWSHACLPTLLSSWILFIVLPKLAFLLWITQLSITSIRRHLKKPFSSRVLCYYFSHSGFFPLVLKIGPIQSQFYHHLKICVLDSPVIDIKGSPTGLSVLLAPTWPIQLSYPSDNLFCVPRVS